MTSKKEQEQLDKEKLLQKQLIVLPSGKFHVSFSELRDWVECSWRHRLKNVDKIDLSTRGPALDFGIAMHSACEHYTRTGEIDVSVATDSIKEAWAKHGHPDLDDYLAQAKGILADLPDWLDVTFPGWKRITAEHRFYEKVSGHDHAFKGFIDAVIEAPGPRNRQLTWLLDWKTTFWGWRRHQKSNALTKAQLIFYKKFWCQEFEIEDPRDVRCAFVLLKRSAKPKNHCELIKVSVGDKSTDKALCMVDNMFKCMKRGLALKNRFSCKWCEYKDTSHCT